MCLFEHFLKSENIPFWLRVWETFGKREIWDHIVRQCFSFFSSPEIHSKSVVWCDYLDQDVPEMLPIGWKRGSGKHSSASLIVLFYIFLSSLGEREDYIWFNRFRLSFKLKDSGDQRDVSRAVAAILASFKDSNRGSIHLMQKWAKVTVLRAVKVHGHSTSAWSASLWESEPEVITSLGCCLCVGEKRPNNTANGKIIKRLATSLKCGKKKEREKKVL